MLLMPWQYPHRSRILVGTFPFSFPSRVECKAPSRRLDGLLSSKRFSIHSVMLVPKLFGRFRAPGLPVPGAGPPCSKQLPILVFVFFQMIHMTPILWTLSSRTGPLRAQKTLTEISVCSRTYLVPLNSLF